MKVKLIAVLVAVAAIFIGAVLWRTDSFVYGDRMSWVEAQTRTQLGAINRSLGTELKSLQRVVSTFNSDNFQKGKLNWNSLAPYYAAASFSVNGANLEPQVLLVRDNSKAAGWNADFIKSAIGSLGNRSKDLRFFVKPFQDSQRGRYVALVFLEGNKAYALFGSGEIFQSLIDSQRGALSSFSIVTSTGLTVGHSIPEYLGTVMRDDPVFKEAQSSGASHGSNTFKLKSGELYGMYELVPQSNLLVISSAPLAETMKGRTGLWWQFLLMGCGLVVVGAAAVLWVIIPVEKEMEILEAQAQLPKAKTLVASIPSAPERTVAADPELVQKDKMEASMRVASALAHEMRGPLASILGYSQSILAKTPEGDIVQNADSIIRETRAARGVLDKLLGFAGEEVKEKNSLKLEGPLVKALKELEPLMARKGVKLVKDIQDTIVMDLHVDAVIRALRNILTNAVEAMERMPKKELRVALYEDALGVHLDIEDTGEGIEGPNLEKIFDPFFTTRSFQNHMGLGLSVAFGILKEHSADVTVDSQRSQGTKVRILFKKEISESVLRAPIRMKEEVMIAPELPQLKEQSTHREEAEMAFAEVKASLPPASPLDINIEKLLELEDAPGEDISAATSSAPHIPPPPMAAPSFTPPNPPPPTFADDELTFVDSGKDEATVIQASAPEEDDFVAPKITAPKSAGKVKTSKLDSYHVEIRRPGKRP